MNERWNINSGALRSGLGASAVAGGNSAGNINGVGSGITSGGGGKAGDSVANGRGILTGGHGAVGSTTFSAANGESGILRRTGHYHQHGGPAENFDDLLVFGYSCKVFRDDERARFIDQGRHLIPWMGDNQLKIDRYDARGALHDLAPYEPPPGGYQDRLEGLTAAEQKAEQLCEEERYFSLYNNEVEEEMYQEEARKREQMLGNQVPFNYDALVPQDGSTVATVEDRTATSAEEQDDDPYTVPKGFDVPSDIPLPETMKEHAIIEKTAKFIASQDAQMEILLKTKQANNPLFDFLNQSGRLFRYYRHVLLAFRTNQYPVASELQTEEPDGTAPGDETEPSASNAQLRPKIIVPAIKYKPSVDCAYTQLISKITGAPIPTITSEEPQPAADSPTSAQRLTSLNSEFDYYPESSSVAIEVKKVSTGLAGLVQYDSDSGGASDEGGADDEKPPGEKEPTDRAQTTQELAPFQGVVPALSIQHVIDRTAIYVGKNGYSFEEALRAKNDARFVFLNRTHEYYPYYAYRVRQRMNAGEYGSGLRQDPSPPPAKVRTETENGTVVETTPSLGIKAVHTAAPKALHVPTTNIQHQKLGAPVSFSLVRKAKEDSSTVKTMSGLGSDEEEEEDQEMPQDAEIEGQSKQPEMTGEDNQKNDTETEKKDPVKAENVLEEDIASDLLLEAADALETPPLVTAVSKSLRAEQEPDAAKEKQAERKKRANMFVNFIKHVDRRPDNTGGSVEDGATEETSAVSIPISQDNTAKDSDNGSIHSIHSTTPSPREPKARSPIVASNGVTTVVEDDDDDDVVIVSETRPAPARSNADPERASNGAGRSRSKKKKSKTRHRSARGKKKSKKQSRTRSPSRSESEPRSGSRRSRSRKRARSKNRRDQSHSTSGSSVSRSSSASNSNSDDNGTRSRRTKRSKRPKRATRSRSVSRSRSRTPSRSKVKRSRKRTTPEKRQRRQDRSRSRSARRRSDSDTENPSRRRNRRRPDGRSEGKYEYDERYPPTRARYWDC